MHSDICVVLKSSPTQWCATRRDETKKDYWMVSTEKRVHIDGVIT